MALDADPLFKSWDLAKGGDRLIMRKVETTATSVTDLFDNFGAFTQSRARLELQESPYKSVIIP
ncbi:hypothetical protein KIN20_005108 [Parelaphostrongylus tenuis]|uniref:Uncharacterized protein n=1 Tax=Parelaphostrongylus tenuis TaxID=148309 RepID=A0AAD5QH86_PARTN|nr:hypothetical protein KIN20_005108 [Parelaphostrongylus tenuis]